jgi:hypothetical protein
MGTIKSNAMGGVGFQKRIGVISCIEFVSVRNCKRKTAYSARLIFEGREATGEYRLVPALPGSLENAQRGLLSRK